MGPWIEITTQLPCTNYCSYCPQQLLMKQYKGERVLTLENFKKILTNIDKDVLIDFAGFCEPFLNPDCGKMMLEAHNQGYKVECWSTLAGLTPETEELIKDIPFTQFVHHDISIGKFDYPFITTRTEVKNPTSRAGNLQDVKFSTYKIDTGRCNRSPDFTVNVMLPNGDVVLCCNDYGLTTDLGNLFITNYRDLKREQKYCLCKYCEDWY